MSAYRKGFGETKYTSFFIKDVVLLEKYNEIWRKVSNSIKKGCDSEPVYNEERLETKKKFMREKSTQIFTIIKYRKKVLKVFVYQ